MNKLPKRAPHQDPKRRIAVYIDGFNLFFGLKSAGYKRYYWLDLVALARSFAREGQSVSAVRYFTARIRSNGRNQRDGERQNVYLDALSSRPELSFHYGHYLSKQRECRNCGSTWTTYEEKMSDVNLAVELLGDAVDDLFDVAIIVSGDSDLSSPIRKVRERFPEKRLLVAFPPKRKSAELMRVAHSCFHISEKALRTSQLPPEVLSSAGVPLRRPASWS